MRMIALLASAAMVVSLFLPWLNPALGAGGFVPWDLVKNIDPDAETLKKFVTEAPPLLLVFLATFPLAALFALLALVGAPVRLLALLAGGGAIGLIGYALWKLRDQATAMGIPLPTTENLTDYAKASTDVFGYGAFAWAGGAAILLLAALVGFGDRR
ncbi:MAG: hypothetical protein R3D63_03950 [Paracoccaceae bacterium]